MCIFMGRCVSIENKTHLVNKVGRSPNCFHTQRGVISLNRLYDFPKAAVSLQMQSLRLLLTDNRFHKIITFLRPMLT